MTKESIDKAVESIEKIAQKYKIDVSFFASVLDPQITTDNQS